MPENPAPMMTASRAMGAVDAGDEAAAVFMPKMVRVALATPCELGDKPAGLGAGSARAHLHANGLHRPALGSQMGRHGRNPLPQLGGHGVVAHQNAPPVSLNGAGAQLGPEQGGQQLLQGPQAGLGVPGQGRQLGQGATFMEHLVDGLGAPTNGGAGGRWAVVTQGLKSRQGGLPRGGAAAGAGQGVARRLAHGGGRRGAGGLALGAHPSIMRGAAG